MKTDLILQDKPGEKLFLLANEAIVRGALEAGVEYVTTYPGTPSSEIGDTFARIATSAGIYFEFSINEKVAMEGAASAAASGLRSMVFMKHVGLNVASDAFMSTAYVGCSGGFVVISADDPSMHSSQNEQDNRYYSLISRVPLLEPSDGAEAKEMTKYAFDLSEELGLPVLVRTTTRVSHVRGIIELGDIRKRERSAEFVKDPASFVPVPANAVKMHKRLLEKREKALQIAESTGFNRREVLGGGSRLGVITSGPAYNYLVDVCSTEGWDLEILKLGMTYPFPRRLVADFLRHSKKVVILEELDPYLEKEARIVAQIEGIDVPIFGKIRGCFPHLYEYNPDIVRDGIAKVFGFPISDKTVRPEGIDLPLRPPVLCPGCSHRATYYAVGAALKKLKIRDVIFPTDIGCYTLGIQPPAKMADYLLCMGSSVGTAGGFSRATGKTVVAFIGDSTFFHAGIPPLINAHHNRHRFLLVILDNRTTAMTGHQPHPGLPVDASGNPAPEVDIEALVRAIGIEYVRVIDPYQVGESVEVMEEALRQEKLAVVIAMRECALLSSRRLRKEGVQATCIINEEKCTQCLTCVRTLACPALFLQDGKVGISQALCTACGVCAQVCPFEAIE